MASVELASVESKNVEVEIGQEESKAESKVVDVPLSAEANNKWAKALEGKSKALPKEAGPYHCCVKPTCNSFGCVYRCCCCFGFDTNTYMRRGLCAVFYIILIFILAMVACAFMAGYACKYMTKYRARAISNPRLNACPGS